MSWNFNWNDTKYINKWRKTDTLMIQFSIYKHSISAYNLNYRGVKIFSIKVSHIFLFYFFLDTW